MPVIITFHLAVQNTQDVEDLEHICTALAEPIKKLNEIRLRGGFQNTVDHTTGFSNRYREVFRNIFGYSEGSR